MPLKIATLALFLLSLPSLASAKEPVMVSAEGGRVDWYKGEAHDLVAFDAVTDASTRNTEIYTMRPDGTGRFCVTCKSPVPKGYIGQPAWHPDGEHLVFQAENRLSKHHLYNHMSWGIDQDLWIIRRDGTGAERIWATPPGHAALDPHFNDAGDLLVFSERAPGRRTKDIWEGWRVHLAQYDASGVGLQKLPYHKVLFDGTKGFYETHGFKGPDRLVFSRSTGGRYVDEILVSDLEGGNTDRIVADPSHWDQHGSFSPSGNVLAFMSSRADLSWKAPDSKGDTLTTEIFLKKHGDFVQLTRFNSAGAKGLRYIASDLSWDREGRRIVFQVAPIKDRAQMLSPQIWVMEIEE